MIVVSSFFCFLLTWEWAGFQAVREQDMAYIALHLWPALGVAELNRSYCIQNTDQTTPPVYTS